MKMVRRAVIYIRTSSEAQGEKASPAEQESDCLLLAKEKGLVVIRVYQDIEKYRVKNKLVEHPDCKRIALACWLCLRMLPGVNSM
jgi:DNA invertase Pin-like site-specific DNA recombinase